MERAASHQPRALASLRRARDPSAGVQNVARRRDLMLRALGHILAAQRLLSRAQEIATDAEFRAVLDAHLERLRSTALSTERLLEELNAAVES
jgi:hypothetical protein